MPKITRAGVSYEPGREPSGWQPGDDGGQAEDAAPDPGPAQDPAPQPNSPEPPASKAKTAPTLSRAPKRADAAGG